MKSSTLAWALSLACFQGANAINGAITRKLDMLANMGLLPDGTPMQLPPDTDVSRRFAAARRATPAKETIVAEYVELPLDNFAKDKDYSYEGTFNNRFWVAEAAYKPGGPVFLYDAGEANAEPGALNRLQNETSFFKQLVDKYNGVGIVWEHRYCRSQLQCAWHMLLICYRRELDSGAN